MNDVKKYEFKEVFSILVLSIIIQLIIVIMVLSVITNVCFPIIQITICRINSLHYLLVICLIESKFVGLHI